MVEELACDGIKPHGFGVSRCSADPAPTARTPRGGADGHHRASGRVTGRPVRVLQVFGLRAQESAERAKRTKYVRDQPR
jgi:hypothetical protein